jgi:AcrR family transcriptional regulator
MSEQRTLDRQEAKSARARETICRATIDCLAEYGYAETSINRVVERAGVSKGALQHHFPSKEDLITATADRLLQRSLDQRPPQTPAGESCVADELFAVWTNLVNTKQYRALLEILTAARTDRQLHKRISPTLRQWNASIDRRMVEIYESPERDDEDVQILMVMNRSLMRGLVIQDRYVDDPSYNLRVVKRWIEIAAPLLRHRNRIKSAT